MKQRKNEKTAELLQNKYCRYFRQQQFGVKRLAHFNRTVRSTSDYYDTHHPFGEQPSIKAHPYYHVKINQSLPSISKKRMKQGGVSRERQHQFYQAYRSPISLQKYKPDKLFSNFVDVDIPLQPFEQTEVRKQKRINRQIKKAQKSSEAITKVGVRTKDQQPIQIARKYKNQSNNAACINFKQGTKYKFFGAFLRATNSQLRKNIFPDNQRGKPTQIIRENTEQGPIEPWNQQEQI